MSDIKELSFDFELRKELLKAEYEFRASKQGWFPCLEGEEFPVLRMVNSPLYANGSVSELPDDVEAITHPFAF